MQDVECPYCKEDVEINHDDGYGYEEGEIFEQECGHCNKTFAYTTGIIYVYQAHEAPCMNDEPHKWKNVTGYPVGYQSNFQRCEWCGKEERKNAELVYKHDTDQWVPKEVKA